MAIEEPGSLPWINPTVLALLFHTIPCKACRSASLKHIILFSGEAGLARIFAEKWWLHLALTEENVNK